MTEPWNELIIRSTEGKAGERPRNRLEKLAAATEFRWPPNPHPEGLDGISPDDLSIAEDLISNPDLNPEGSSEFIDAPPELANCPPASTSHGCAGTPDVIFNVTLNPFRDGQYQGPRRTVQVAAPTEAICRLHARPGDVLWVQSVGEDVKLDYQVRTGPDGLTLEGI